MEKLNCELTRPTCAMSSMRKKVNDIIGTLGAHNLLDNSDFRNPVNQRGNSSYSGTYGIDRWRVWDDGNIMIEEDGVSAQNATMFQYFYLGVLNNALHTLAVMTTGGTLMLTVMNPHNQFDFAENGLGIGIDNGVHVIGLPPGHTYAWAALYEGEYTAETLPPYTTKGYTSELTECMRYFQTLKIGGAVQENYIGFRMPLPIKMRVKPTIMQSNMNTTNGNVVIAAGGYTAESDSIRADVYIESANEKWWADDLILSADL